MTATTDTGVQATAAQRLALFACELDGGAVPADVRAAARLHLLDVVGCGVAAAALGISTEARAAIADGAEGGAATVIGLRQGARPADAALANGTLCHGLDFDDTHSDSISHISAVVVPAALAVAQARGASGSDLLDAVIVGNEVVARVGSLAAPSYMERGFHPTSVCGVFGAAAAASRLSGLGAAGTANALGIAGSMASGLFEYLSDGSSTKPLHAGWAAHGGVTAAALAAHGATGPATVLEGRFGVLRAFFGIEGSSIALPGDDGGVWETPRISYKPYPACHFVHSCVDAAEALRREASLVPDLVEDVLLLVPAPAVPLVLEPWEAKVAPRTSYDAKFSLQYSVASMLVHGTVGLVSYGEDAILDPDVLGLAQRVRYEVVDFPTYPQAFPGGVRIRVSDGRTVEHTLPYQRGSVEHPMTETEIRAKFRDNASLGLDAAAVLALEAAVLGLDDVSDVAEAFAILGAAAERDDGSEGGIA